LDSTRSRGKPRNRWQDEVREDGRIVGGEKWQEKVYNRDKWKKLQRTARNRHILNKAVEWMFVVTITQTTRLHRLCWFGHVQRVEENRITKRVMCMNLESTRPRNRWQDEAREDGRTVGGEEWQEKVYNREEWKKLLRTARNRHILHMAVEWMDDYI
jgi:hypothetical protein